MIGEAIWTIIGEYVIAIIGLLIIGIALYAFSKFG